MAMHFTESAALLGLPAAKKLVLMAFADSADKDSRVAIPGFDTVMQWSGLKRSQAYDVVAELVEDGYLARRAAGRSGRRAEFFVFPRGGCCPLHSALPDFLEPSPEDDETPTEDQGSGSGTPDPDLRTEQAEHQPEVAAADGQPSTRSPGSGSGSGTGSGLDRTPSRLPGSKNPPNPPASRGAKCTHGKRSGCRPCGTSPRAALQAAAAAEAVEAAQLELRRAAVPWCGGYHCDRTTRRVFDADTGKSARCPDCHPDLVVGPAPSRTPAPARRPGPSVARAAPAF